jgi:FlaG/FlaF family flagellin (archaellin)
MRIRHLTLTPPIVLSVAAILVTLAGTAYAATGGSFVLGKRNTADMTTALTAGQAGTAALQVTNSAAAPAASFAVSSGAPITVNRTGVVANLNADRLDSIDSKGFLRVHSEAVNSNLLGGIDSTGLIRGDGFSTDRATAMATAVAPGSTASFEYGDGWEIFDSCPANLANPGGLSIFNNNPTQGMNLFTEPQVSSPALTVLGPEAGTAALPADPAGEVWVFRMQSNGFVGTVEVATVNRATDCFFQVQGMSTAY